MREITHLQFLESEAIYVLRETAAQFTKPAMLFSGGKDSIVMAWLARKAFHPARLPFALLLKVEDGHHQRQNDEDDDCGDQAATRALLSGHDGRGHDDLQGYAGCSRPSRRGQRGR